jgi:hypothetical protein
MVMMNLQLGVNMGFLAARTCFPVEIIWFLPGNGMGIEQAKGLRMLAGIVHNL